MILDTCFLIDLLRGDNEKVKTKSKELDEKFNVKAIASVTLMELWRGALQSIQKTEEKKRINELLQSLFMYSFSEFEAKKSGEIETILIKKGGIVDMEDIMIAGTAIVKNDKILTRNVKHFENIEGLSVESY